MRVWKMMTRRNGTMTRKNILKEMITMLEEGKMCCICGAPIEDWGNNPYPVVKWDGARCCDYCNQTVVIPARLAELYRKENE